MELAKKLFTLKPKMTIQGKYKNKIHNIERTSGNYIFFIDEPFSYCDVNIRANEENTTLVSEIS